MNTMASLGYENLFQNFKQEVICIESTGLKLKIDPNFMRFCAKYGAKQEVIFFLLVIRKAISYLIFLETFIRKRKHQ